MSRRLDLLPECNGKHAPIDTFTTECCARCINPECTRSQYGNSKFDQRVTTWFQRLFEEVPRMDAQDPRFAAIAGQKFQIIDVSRTPEILTGSWVDPRDLDTPPVVRTPPRPVADPPAPIVESTLAVAAIAQQPPAPVPSAGGSKSIPRQMLLANTPAQETQTIQPVTSPTASTVQSDRWAGPLPKADPEKPISVVKPGATVKLGGSGV